MEYKQEDNKDSVLQLMLTEEIKREEIVSSYIFDKEIANLSLELNHKYSKKKITSPLESTWPKTMDTFIKELKRKRISADHISMICDVADNYGDTILKWRKNEEPEPEQVKKESIAEKIIRITQENCQELFTDQYGMSCI